MWPSYFAGRSLTLGKENANIFLGKVGVRGIRLECVGVGLKVEICLKLFYFQKFVRIILVGYKEELERKPNAYGYTVVSELPVAFNPAARE